MENKTLGFSEMQDRPETGVSRSVYLKLEDLFLNNNYVFVFSVFKYKHCWLMTISGEITVLERRCLNC